MPMPNIRTGAPLREEEVGNLYLAGYSVERIADILGIQQQTVVVYLKAIGIVEKALPALKIEFIKKRYDYLIRTLPNPVAYSQAVWEFDQAFLRAKEAGASTEELADKLGFSLERMKRMEQQAKNTGKIPPIVRYLSNNQDISKIYDTIKDDNIALDAIEELELAELARLKAKYEN
jgi:DNA-binding CsgD family transcriptional regulator